MREILFRAKSNYGNVGEWEYGLVAQPHVTEKGVVTSYYFTKICENGWTSQRTVSANTIGQYTGLTDKNGKKIFEGDIIAGAVWWQEQAKNGLVAFKDGSFGLIWYRGEVEQFNAFTSMCNIEYEVIGNIHDNPELLKGGAE